VVKNISATYFYLFMSPWVPPPRGGDGNLPLRVRLSVSNLRGVKNHD